ncbi:MAG: GNAT family N-acetyltransferase, partial [Anaerolineae bacterium]|nr:GNAT family N-acetyltransferase [Anaerolineae bacterium]
MSQQPWELVRATEADLPAVQELTRQEYGPDTLAHPDHWRWFTRGNPNGPACAWLAKANDEIIAVAMAQLVRAKVGDRQALVHVFLNMIVRPDFRRQGVISHLVPWALEDSPKLGSAFMFGATALMKGVWRKFGLDMIGPASPLMLKPLDVGAILAFKGIKGHPIHWLASAGYKMIAPFLRRRWFNRPDPDLAVSEVISFDERFDRFWERVKQKYHTLLVRDAVFLQWRYKDVPLKSARCFVATDSEGEIVAYIIFRGTDLEGIATGMILDLLIEPSERGRQAGNQLVALATRQFQHDRLALGTCIMLRHTHEIKILR